jgi:hypothetical protein
LTRTKLYYDIYHDAGSFVAEVWNAREDVLYQDRFPSRDAAKQAAEAYIMGELQDTPEAEERAP